jgi:anaerobic selenocysteine-containing dehydrogenase
MGMVQGESMDRRFFHRLGASQLDRTICASAGAEALVQTLGGKVGMKVEFFAQAKLILIWGSNSIGSNLHFWRYVQQAKRNGARLVCIDPRKTETADKCHEHIALYPGTDAALALALMHELIKNDWLDHDYIARHTLGWEQLRERALQWPPERAAEVCGVPAEQIRQLARDYGTTQPAAIRLNYGMQRVRGGGNAVRAVACLPALTGAWRHRAGGMLLSSSGQFPAQRAALQRPDLMPARTPRTLNMVQIGDDLLREASPAFGPRVEALVVYNSNPVAVAPDSGKVVQGFAREDLFTVVLEHFQTDTADYADFILPATTQLEHWDVHLAYGHTDVMLNRPAIAARGPGTQQCADLPRPGGAHGLCRALLCRQRRSLCRQAFGDAVDYALLETQGFATLALPDAPFAEGHFCHALGPLRILQRPPGRAGPGRPARPPAQPRAAGQRRPLPAGHDLAASAQLFELHLRERAKPAHHRRPPVLEIHPDDAAARGIATAAVVRVFNDRGSYRATLRSRCRARPGVVNGLGIWWRKLGLNGTNVNELTSQALTDLGRAPTFYDCLVEVGAVLCGGRRRGNRQRPAGAGRRGGRRICGGGGCGRGGCDVGGRRVGAVAASAQQQAEASHGCPSSEMAGRFFHEESLVDLV